jgi:hypothetical protein
MSIRVWRRVLVSVVLPGILLAVLLGALQGARVRAAALDLFAEPGGTGTCYSPVSPCDLQEAIKEAWDGDTIYVAEGVYTGTGDQVAEITETLTLYGGWDGAVGAPIVHDPELYPSVLDGENERRGLYIYGGYEGITATIDGLVIRRGNAANVETARQPGNGGGIYAASSVLSVFNSVISNNVAHTSTSQYGYGGGLYAVGSAGVVISGSMVVSNLASTSYYGRGGGIAFQGGSDNLLIAENEILSNTGSAGHNGSGGGIYLGESAGVRIERNLMRGNIASSAAESSNGYGGGLMAYAVSSLTLDANQIISNAASAEQYGFGGGLYLSREIVFTMTNNVVAWNAADSGGGVSFETNKPGQPVVGKIVNNTFYANDRGEGDEGRAAIHLRDASVTVALTNNIFYSHTYGVYAPATTTATLHSNLFYSSSVADTAGAGSITNANPITGQDPLVSADWHLASGSPAIDAGTDVPWLTWDFEGEPRPRGGVRFDIGADEGGFLAFVPLTLRE